MVTNNLKNKKILITGATGFIGSHLCRELLKKGSIIHGISRTNQKPVAGITWWKNNLKDYKSLEQLMKKIKPDIVYHLAGEVTGSRNLEAILPTLQSNLVSTVNILTAATNIGCQRVIVIGSMEEPVKNQTACSPYAASKASSAIYCKLFYSLYQTPVVNLKLFMVYGEAQKDTKKLIPYVTNKLLQNEMPKLSSGKRLVDWIYIDDVVEALILSATALDIEGSEIEIGTGKFISVKNVVKKIKDLTLFKDPLQFGSLTDRPFEQVRKANISTAYKKLGWKPKVSLNQGLKNTVDWFKKNEKSV